MKIGLGGFQQQKYRQKMRDPDQSCINTNLVIIWEKQRGSLF
jgi:hypothetical protein